MGHPQKVNKGETSTIDMDEEHSVLLGESANATPDNRQILKARKQHLKGVAAHPPEFPTHDDSVSIGLDIERYIRTKAPAKETTTASGWFHLYCTTLTLLVWLARTIEFVLFCRQSYLLAYPCIRYYCTLGCFS